MLWLSNASRSFLTYIQDLRFLSHLHPCTVSLPSRYQDSCLTSTHFPIYMPHLHLGHVSPPSKSRELHLNSIIVPSHPIQVSRCASRLNPGPISHPSKSEDVHPCSVPPPSRSLDSHITYIQVAFQLNPGPNVCISHQSRWCITSFLV